MKWNLRLTAANRGIWKASELQRMLAERGLVISAGKMSGLWSGNPNAIKLHDLDVFCAVLGCGINELLIPEPGKITRPDAPKRRHTRQPRTQGRWQAAMMCWMRLSGAAAHRGRLITRMDTSRKGSRSRAHAGTALVAPDP